jgi:hypothetical protein
MNKQISMLVTGVFITLMAESQDIHSIIRKTREKIQTVNDYEATGKMKTNVAFLKVPVANVKLYFKKPNKLKLKSEKGVSFIPRGAVSINMNNLLIDNNFTVIDAGSEKIGNTVVRIAKLLPNDENSDVVLSTVYIDSANNVIRKAKTTTRENGTYELEMTYGKYMEYGLPDKIIFSFNTKDYKLPKGITFDFDDGTEKAPVKNDGKPKKGKAEIVFFKYLVNKGVADELFK